MSIVSQTVRGTILFLSIYSTPNARQENRFPTQHDQKQLQIEFQYNICVVYVIEPQNETVSKHCLLFMCAIRIFANMKVKIYY